MIDLANATEVFVTGFARTRSLSYPREVERVGEFWVCRDIPAREKSRVVDLVGVEQGAEGFAEICSAEPEERWSCCYADPGVDKKVSPSGFKAAGFRRSMMLPLFGVDTALGFDGDERVVRVLDFESAERVRKASGGGKHLMPEDLEDGAAARRVYAVFREGEPVGWVSSVPVGTDCSYVANLFVAESERGKGLGRALMASMLADDLKYGVKWSVLTASEDGARLYEKMGYGQVGTLHFLRPPNYKSAKVRGIR